MHSITHTVTLVTYRQMSAHNRQENEVIHVTGFTEQCSQKESREDFVLGPDHGCSILACEHKAENSCTVVLACAVGKFYLLNYIQY